MAKSESYRQGLAGGMNWRRSLVSFDDSKISRQRKRLKRVKKESRYDLSEWMKGFRIGYAFERKRK